MSNPYWEKVSAIAERQRAKGIATYGQGIEMNPADAITRIEYLQEELVDALMYCEWIKDGIKNPVSVVRCKDCMYYDAKRHRCDHPNLNYDVECYDQWIDTEPDDFCSYGERRAAHA